MNEASKLRRLSDLEKLQKLQGKIPGVLDILRVVGNPPTSIFLRICIPTAKNEKYPIEKQDVSDIEINFPENYPFPPGPTVKISTPIWNPNIYASGKWCFGDWKVTENLELFVIRLIKVIALDPSIVNPNSPANSTAASWYTKNLRSQPGIFPTKSLDLLLAKSDKPKIIWKTMK